MAKRGAKSKYTPEMVAEIVKLLTGGCVVADVCHKVNITQETFYQWVNRYPEFSENVKRAKADAHVGATLSLRKAMMPHDVSSVTTKTLRETRLRKVKDKSGTISEVPYEYIKTEQSQTVSNEFDWRAAMEYLKRRDPENWAETFIIKVNPQQMEVLKKYGLTAAEAFEAMIAELAAAKADA